MPAMRSWGRWITILFFLVGAIIVWFIVDRVKDPLGAWLSGFVFLVMGVAFSERKLIVGWAMSFFRTAHLLRQQEDSPENYVKLSIVKADLNPDRLKPKEDVTYIRIWLSWDNRSYKKISIQDIQGEISIEGHSPSDCLPSNITDMQLMPFLEKEVPVISVNLTGDGLRIVQQIRTKGFGKANMTVKLRVKIDGKSTPYDAHHTAFYVG